MQAGRFQPAIMLIVGAAWLVSGCSPGRRPYLQAQFCIDSNESALLIDMLEDIALAEGMTFADGSAEIDAVALHQREVTGIAQARPGPIISLAVYGGPNGSVSVGNTGLPDQMFVGFGYEADIEKASAFAEHVLGRLGSQWDIQRASGEEGMQPLACPATAKAPSQDP